MMRIGRMSVLMALAMMCGASAALAQDGVTTRSSATSSAGSRCCRCATAWRCGRRRSPSVRSIEITSGTIAIDGQPATGAELRTRLGADADAILQLSYLSDSARRALFRQRQLPPFATAATRLLPPPRSHHRHRQ